MKILYYLHNLEINGSNIAALNFFVGITDSFFAFSVSSKSDGPMREIFKKNQVKVLIEEPNIYSAKNYDLFVINSLIRVDVLKFLDGIKAPFYQYIHEDWGPDDFSSKAHSDWGWKLDSCSNISKLLESSRGLIFPANYISKLYESFNKYVLFNPVNPKSLIDIRKINTSFGCGIDIINIGTINSRKNQKLIAHLSSNYKDITSCRFFGARTIRTEEIKYTNQMIRYSNKSTSCKFEYNKTKYPLNIKIYKNTVFVHASIGEVLPCTVQEMMVLGVPVVAPNRFGLPEVICSGDNGFLFNEYKTKSIHDGVTFVVKNYQKIACNSTEFAEKEFNLAAQSQKLKSILLK
jgi:glycosyltransferase involved in cell wall biosynthesis